MDILIREIHFNTVNILFGFTGNEYFNKNPIFDTYSATHSEGIPLVRVGGAGEVHFRGCLHFCPINKAVDSHI